MADCRNDLEGSQNSKLYNIAFKEKDKSELTVEFWMEKNFKKEKQKKSKEIIVFNLKFHNFLV
jgi:hypothetical protein